MGIRTEVINIFTDRAIAKDASIVLSTPIYLGKCGAGSAFWMDASLTGSGAVQVTQQIANLPEADYYTPGNARDMCSSHDSGRDRYDAYIMGTEWVKFKAKERNISTATLTLDLIVSSA